MDTYYKIPKRLEEYRKRISFTQEQMGDIMGVGQDHYQRLEKGTVIISNNGLEKIEEHGGDIYYLITGEKQKTGIVNELLESCSNQKEKELLLRFYILCIEAELTKIQGEIKDEIHHYLRMSERALEEDTIWRGIRLLEKQTTSMDAHILNQLFQEFRFFPFQLFERGKYYLNGLYNLAETLPDSEQNEIERKMESYMSWIKREEPLQ